MNAPYTLDKLPYAFDALEPAISAKIMEIHYTKHHLAYVNNLNAALEKYVSAEAKGDLAAMMALQKTILFNAGGHINHTLFWKNLAPVNEGGGVVPSGVFSQALGQTFGNFAAFVEKMSAMTCAIQGSGWGWLGYDPSCKRLVITTCANQDPLSTQGLVPLLGIDVWEHAYYLQYAQARVEYVKNIWSVINWKEVEARYLHATQ